ncbi:MAG: hypothetical protein R3D43_06425 [Tepidamorphaceae bacterium]
MTATLPRSSRQNRRDSAARHFETADNIQATQLGFQLAGNLTATFQSPAKSIHCFLTEFIFPKALKNRRFLKTIHQSGQFPQSRSVKYRFAAQQAANRQSKERPDQPVAGTIT